MGEAFQEHVRLGPIFWADGGMAADTADGFRVVICPEPDGTFAIGMLTPKAYEGVASQTAYADSLTEARAIVAQEITNLRAEERSYATGREFVDTFLGAFYGELASVADPASPLSRGEGAS